MLDRYIRMILTGYGIVFYFMGVLLVIAFSSQLAWYWRVLDVMSVQSSELNPYVIVVYGGPEYRIWAGFRIAGNLQPRWLIFSGSNYSYIEDIRRMRFRDVSYSITIIPEAWTTDQNARTVMPVLKEIGVKSAVLVTSWYHMPRAYFLTRLYAIGSGIRWDCVSADPVPVGWWRRTEFLVELLKFWGSMGRVVLAWFGIATGGR